MNVKDYVGDLIGASLLITESRIIADYLLKDLSDDEWKSLVIEQNIGNRQGLNCRCRAKSLPSGVLRAVAPTRHN